MDASEEDDRLIGELMAVRPEQADTFARSLRASVRRSLVGAADEQYRLGRFVVLEPLGRGGMGSVFVAYDPDLDRKIALKVLHNRGERGRREMLREGRALARLKHPDVVGVYEVGELDEHVFVAMEYVEGHDLREWLRAPRTLEAILARLVEAGRGLAAAHAVDVIHHDFKPDNVVIDDRDHARVIDFGLARLAEEPAHVGQPVADAPATAVSLGGGTPAYMAPERLAGAAGDRRSDQYSYCVTCWEALFGARPGREPWDPTALRVPAWLRRVLERGLAADPARRWPSMAALLAAIERGQRGARRWRVAAVVAAVAALVAGAEGLRRRSVARQVAACEASGDAIFAAWDDDARQRLDQAFAATGMSYAAVTAEKVAPRLDEHAAAWKQARTDACLHATVHARWSEDTLARAVFCLEDRQMIFAALVAEFGRADATAVRKAVAAVAGLRPPHACLDERLLARLPAPPVREQEVIRELRRELSRADSLGLAGKFQAALELATEVRARAGAVDWPPLSAAARALEGNFLEQTGAYEPGAAASADAYFAAARAGAWAVATEAANKAIITVGHRLARHEEGRAWARHAEVALAHAGDWDGLAESTRLGHLAVVLADAGELTEALAQHRRALELRERALGPEHPDVAINLSNLALVHDALGDYSEAKALHERVLGIWQHALGAEHPFVAVSLNNLAVAHEATGAFAEARALHERVLALRERTLGPDDLAVASTLNNLANIHQLTGAHVEARALYERALAIRERALGPDHVEVADVLGNLGHAMVSAGAHAEARAAHERALAIRQAVLGPDHADTAMSLLGLGAALDAAGAHAEARALYERALATTEKALGPDHPAVALSLLNLASLRLAEQRPRDALELLERAVALVDAEEGVQEAEPQVRFALAQALVAADGDRDRALAAARQARDQLRDTGGAPTELADVDRWLAGHAGEPP